MEQIDYYEFKIRVVDERDKTHDKALTHIKELQNDYDNQLRNLNNDFKQKEEKLKNKFQDYKSSLDNKFKSHIEDQEAKIKTLNKDLSEMTKEYENIECEAKEMRNLLQRHDIIMKSQAEEYEETLLMKEKKINDLELYIRSIKDETNKQIGRFDYIIKDLEDQIRQREEVLGNEISRVNHINASKMKEQSIDMINYIEDKYVNDNNELKKTISILNSENKQLESNLTVIAFNPRGF
jgi:DNA repair exonuclease SbcCD ATPase subunit